MSILPVSSMADVYPSFQMTVERFENHLVEVGMLKNIDVLLAHLSPRNVDVSSLSREVLRLFRAFKSTVQRRTTIATRHNNLPNLSSQRLQNLCTKGLQVADNGLFRQSRLAGITPPEGSLSVVLWQSPTVASHPL